jgi:hypothetical protein
MGRRRTELTADQMTQVEALAAYLTQEQIADFFGITRLTFQAMVARDENISMHYKKGKAKAIGAIAQGLISKARAGDTASAIFYLKTQAGWRETQVIESNNTTSIGFIDPKRLITFNGIAVAPERDDDENQG